MLHTNRLIIAALIERDVNLSVGVGFSPCGRIDGRPQLAAMFPFVDGSPREDVNGMASLEIVARNYFQQRKCMPR